MPKILTNRELLVEAILNSLNLSDEKSLASCASNIIWGCRDCPYEDECDFAKVLKIEDYDEFEDAVKKIYETHLGFTCYDLYLSKLNED